MSKGRSASRRKKLGEVLVEAGLISKNQLLQALEIQKSEGKKLGRVLIDLGYATETLIAETLSKQLSCPLVELEGLIIPPEVKVLIPKEIAEKKSILPIECTGKTLLLAMANPLDWETIDETAFRTGLKIAPAIAEEAALLRAIEAIYGNEEKSWNLLDDISVRDEVEFTREVEDEADAVNIQALYKNSQAPPIVKLVTMIIVNAVKERASDIHIEPRDKQVKVRYRVDGILRNVLNFPKYLQNPVVSRIKIICSLDITNRRLPQDGSSHLKLENRDIDLRVSTLPSIHGEKIVIRLLDRETGLIPLTSLGTPEFIFNSLIETFAQPQGMLLVTGPTGSGKSTTLYACLNQLRSETENIVTIEDPVEYKLDGITQVAVNEAVGLTFAGALRSILRQDPDIIMVGEIRDLETAEIAIKASLTGHLVLCTLHTNDTVSTLIRLLDLGLPHYLLASATNGILAQRLIRKICENCKTPAEPPQNFIAASLPPIETFYTGAGCQECSYTGFLGQIGVFEYLQITRDLRRLIAKQATEEELWDAARRSGMTTLFEDAWAKIRDGVTSVDEVIMKVPISHADKKGAS